MSPSYGSARTVCGSHGVAPLHERWMSTVTAVSPPCRDVVSNDSSDLRKVTVSYF